MLETCFWCQTQYHPVIDLRFMDNGPKTLGVTPKTTAWQIISHGPKH